MPSSWPPRDGPVNRTGEDIRFIDADGFTVLSHEIEEWNESGTSYVWVKVPQIDGASSSDHIWLYYDNPLAADAQDAVNLWTNGYEGVWHLNELTPSGLVIDWAAKVANVNPTAGADQTELPTGGQ